MEPAKEVLKIHQCISGKHLHGPYFEKLYIRINWSANVTSVTWRSPATIYNYVTNRAARCNFVNILSISALNKRGNFARPRWELKVGSWSKAGRRLSISRTGHEIKDVIVNLMNPVMLLTGLRPFDKYPHAWGSKGDVFSGHLFIGIDLFKGRICKLWLSRHTKVWHYRDQRTPSFTS